ncbi:MAG: RnfABCDGE type electron transport complex subunit C [Bacilli bacterium]|jgi:electron transport complex protein RnfC
MNIFQSLVMQKIDAHKAGTCHHDVVIVDEKQIKSVFLPIVGPNGAEIELFAKEGDHVDVGTPIGRRKDFYVPIFSSVSGTVKGKVNRYNPIVGRATPHYEIENDFLGTRAKPLTTVTMEAAREELVAAIKEAGLVGLGGAGFPTYVKYENVKGIDTLIINGVECEPYLSTDFKVGEAYALDVVKGSELFRLACGAARGIIAIKVKKPELKAALLAQLGEYPNLSLVEVPNVYPMGWERTLIKKLTGRTYDKLPSEAHVLVNNLTTAYAAARSLLYGEPLTHRIVTLSGAGLVNETNVLVPIGTPVDFIVKYIGGYAQEEVTAFAGGPMSSKAVSDDTFVIQAPMGAYTVLPPAANQEIACLRCGSCTMACPAYLQPIEIKIALDGNNVDRLLKLDVMRCVECGLCSYVCPSKIEVTEAVRKAKVKVRIAQAKAAFAKK